MELHDFIKTLEHSLVRRGIPPEVANKHVATLRRTFADDDLNEIKQIQSSAEVEEIAESIALVLTKNRMGVKPPRPTENNTAKQVPQGRESNGSELPPSPRPTPEVSAENRAVPPASEIPLAQRPAPSYLRKERKQTKASNEIEWLSDEEDGDFFEEFSGEDKTKKGFYTFWGLFLVTLPLTVLLAAAFFGLFVVTLAVLTALIVGLVAGVVALVAAGAAVSLFGIIFGVTQLFSFPAAGLFEIGIGIIVIGVVMFVSILVYNAALRFLPWVMGKVCLLLKFICGKLRDLFLHLRRECYRL